VNQRFDLIGIMCYSGIYVGEFMLDNMINDIVSNDSKFLKKYNNIYITDEQVDILNKYGFDVMKYGQVSRLIYDIEMYLNYNHGDYSDLEYVEEMLSEYNYYNNTNK